MNPRWTSLRGCKRPSRISMSTPIWTSLSFTVANLRSMKSNKTASRASYPLVLATRPIIRFYQWPEDYQRIKESTWIV